jgi:hypothetical protein
MVTGVEILGVSLIGTVVVGTHDLVGRNVLLNPAQFVDTAVCH